MQKRAVGSVDWRHEVANCLKAIEQLPSTDRVDTIRDERKD